MPDQTCGLGEPSHTVVFEPFPEAVRSPDRRYCADKAFWEIYRASLLLQAQEERRRCRQILEDYLKRAPKSVRHHIQLLINKIELSSR